MPTEQYGIWMTHSTDTIEQLVVFKSLIFNISSWLRDYAWLTAVALDALIWKFAALVKPNIPIGHPPGTTQDAGFSTSTGCPIVGNSGSTIDCVVEGGINYCNEQTDNTTVFIEDNPL